MEQEGTLEAQLVRDLAQATADYMDKKAENIADGAENLFPASRNETSRTNIRLTGSQIEVLSRYKGYDGFSSKEMALGAMVAFAMTHMDEFRDFVKQQKLAAIGEEYSAVWDTPPEFASDSSDSSAGAEEASVTTSADRSNTEQTDDESGTDGEYAPKQPPNSHIPTPDEADEFAERFQ